MKRTIFVYVLFAAISGGLAAQQASQNNPYAGTSNPPPDTSIHNARAGAACQAPAAEAIAAAMLQTAQPAAPAQRSAAPAHECAAQPCSSALPSHSTKATAEPGMADGTDDGIVQVAPDAHYLSPL